MWLRQSRTASTVGLFFLLHPLINKLAADGAIAVLSNRVPQLDADRAPREGIVVRLTGMKIERKSPCSMKVKLLVGQSISRVRYSTIEYSGKPYGRHEDFHTPSCVELTLDGIIFQIGWDGVKSLPFAILRPRQSESLWRKAPYLGCNTAPRGAPLSRRNYPDNRVWCSQEIDLIRRPDYLSLEITLSQGADWLSVRI